MLLHVVIFDNYFINWGGGGGYSWEVVVSRATAQTTSQPTVRDAKVSFGTCTAVEHTFDSTEHEEARSAKEHGHYDLMEVIPSEQVEEEVETIRVS